ncbi:MAG: glycosyltransferase family 39 protein [Chlamydiia bacterium]|nr:glycosyltransferase family 39 protein [Chlamydiia bacterium]
MKRLLPYLLIKALLILILILFSPIRLSPDEAQYWTWSRHLDWGYYSKPPGIAWQIWLGTYLFGPTELGVRFLSLIIGFFIPLATYRLAIKSNCTPEQSFWAGLLLALSPLGILSSFFAITDVGMTLFFILATTALVQKKILPCAFYIACGALFKWPIYILWLFHPWNIPAIIVSLFGLTPSLIWNAQHDWATFQHVGSTIAVTTPSPPNPLEFFFAQMALLSPVIFCLYLFSYRKKIPPLTGLVPATILLTLLISSSFQKIQGNWASFVYPLALVYTASQITNRLLLRLGAITAPLLFLIVLLLAPLSYRTNAFRHNMGWDNIAPQLLQAGYIPDEHFLFSDKYQMTSLLSFYGPEQHQAYFFNLQGSRKNQFSYWPQMPDKELFNTGYFVRVEHTLRNNFIEELSPYFASVIPYPATEISPGMYLLIYRCTLYNGNTPPVTSHY